MVLKTTPARIVVSARKCTANRTFRDQIPQGTASQCFVLRKASTTLFLQKTIKEALLFSLTLERKPEKFKRRGKRCMIRPGLIDLDLSLRFCDFSGTINLADIRGVRDTVQDCGGSCLKSKLPPLHLQKLDRVIWHSECARNNFETAKFISPLHWNAWQICRFHTSVLAVSQRERKVHNSL